MGIGIDEKRRMVKQAYPGIYWKDRVDYMSDVQVSAIYASLKRRGRLVYASDLKKNGDIYHQITIEEWMKNV